MVGSLLGLELKIFQKKKDLENFLSPFFYWYARLDSNQRLSAPEADALSPELRAHFKVLGKNLNISYKLELISKIEDHVQ